MYLVWEAMSKLIPDLYIGQGIDIHWNRNIHGAQFYRHNGICFYLSCCDSFRTYSGWGLCSLSNYQHWDASPGKIPSKMAHECGWNLNIYDIEPRQAPVRSSSILYPWLPTTLIARYYRFFMYYYALSLRTASFLMVNSSWTKNHIDSILQHSDILLDAIHMLPPLFLINFFVPRNAPQSAKIVYPPCDTREMVKFSVTNRERIILSVAQFR